MASYAEIASHGPPQSDEEVSEYALAVIANTMQKVPHAVSEIAHDDSSVHSLNSQGSINLKNPVPSYAEQGKQSEEAAARRAEEEKRAKKDAEQFGKKAENKAAELERDTKKAYSDVKKEASNDYDQAKKDVSKGYQDVTKEASKGYENVKKEASKDYKEVKKQVNTEAEKVKKNAKKAEQWAEDNKSNPVVIGNAVVVTALAGLIGVGAYRKYTAGELTWKVAGTWAGVVGLFAVGDYYVSSWLFKNKYPPKN